MNQYLYAWAATDRLTFLRYQKLKKFFGDLETAWKKLEKNTLRQAGLEEKFVTEILTLSQKISPQEEYEKVQKLGIDLVYYEDKNYPLLLKEIASPPVFLFLKGEIFADESCLAVVGARQISTYGEQVVKTIVANLAQQGLTIVSGLALGTDGLSHQAALNANAKTIAVLGSGLDQIYPLQNQALAEKILGKGALISEFPLGTPPHHYNFPRRNRIISGMSVGTLVVEAKLKSGSLITARNAIEQNREVFAIPGSIYNQKSKGTNYLIQKGEAKLIQTAKDVLEELNLKLLKSQNVIKKIPDFSGLNSIENQIINLLSQETILFDNLKNQVSITTAELSSVLTILEMKGLVNNLGNNQWIKAF